MAAGGRFHHIRAQGRDHERRAATHIFARLGAESLFKSFTLTANGRLTRNEVGDRTCRRRWRAPMSPGLPSATAISTRTTPCSSPMTRVRCESRQVFKKVLKNGAVGVFQGKILVKPGAQKTDGYQISQSLLLDEDSQFLAKPELEIYADDVKCSHGSTSGAIDETALFYLRSRGVPRSRRSRCWCWPSWPRRSPRSTTPPSPRISASGWKTGLPGTRAEWRSPPISSKATAARASCCAAGWAGSRTRAGRSRF